MRVIFSAILALLAVCCLAALLLIPMLAVFGHTSQLAYPPGTALQPGTVNMNVESLTIFMIFAIPLAAVVGGIFLAALKILKGNGSGRGGQADQEETRLIQELHRGLRRMEDRVDALETLMMEKSTHRKTHD